MGDSKTTPAKGKAKAPRPTSKRPAPAASSPSGENASYLEPPQSASYLGTTEDWQVPDYVDAPTAFAMSPEQLQLTYQRLTEELAIGGFSKALADERATVETAAAAEDVRLDREAATPPGDFVALYPTVVNPPPDWKPTPLRVSSDPYWVRSWIEQVYIDGADLDIGRGRAALERLGDVVADASPAPDDMTADRVQVELIAELARQILAFEAELDAFEAEFFVEATTFVTGTLDRSEEVARAELARYGIEASEYVPKDMDAPGSVTIVSGGDTAEARALAEAAGKLAANQRAIDQMYVRADDLAQIDADWQIFREQGEIGAGRGAEGYVDPGTMAEELHGVQNGDDLPAMIAALQRVLTTARVEQTKLIETSVAEFPLLAQYKATGSGGDVRVDADGLDRIRTAGAHEIYDKIAPVLANITRTREAFANGRLSVWREPRVVQAVMAQLEVPPGSLRDLVVRDKISADHSSSWSDWAVMVLAFGLALVSAIPTGGSSVVAAVAATATIADATTTFYLVADHVAQYRAEKAATGTDLDAQARAISADEPSLLWLAVDIVSSSVGLGGAAKAFGHIAEDLSRAARMSAAELDIAIADVYRLAREGTLSADAAARLEQELRGASQAAVRRVAMQAKVAPEQLSTLQERLGVTVELDDALANGVELHYAETPGRFGIGTDIEPTVVKVGRAATVGDVLAHRATIARITRYNGVVGKLRGLWDRWVAEAGTANPFAPGTLGWESWEELNKLDALIEARRAHWNPNALDAGTLGDEIAFLEGRRAFHEEVLRGAEDAGLVRGLGHIDAPDVGKVTAEARAKGYALPGEPGQLGAAEQVNPDWYYYRNSTTRPGEYELARKPSAPETTPAYRAVTDDGTFTGLEPGVAPRPRTLLEPTLSRADVIAYLRDGDSFAAFAGVLEDNGLATHEEIDDAIAAAYRGAMYDDVLRGNVKDVFRDRIVAALEAETSSPEASWLRMRELLGPLAPSDRGNLAEQWYQWYELRFVAPEGSTAAARHVAAQVTRESGAAEARVIDLLRGGRAIEIKDVAGSIDKEQFAAYVDLLRQGKILGKDGPIEIGQLQYVFTNPDGAKANLEFFAEQFQKFGADLDGKLFIEVFDEQGGRHVAADESTTRALLGALGA